MQKYLLFILVHFSFAALAQQKITFNYDQAGNQILRELCLSGCSTSAKHIDDIIEIEALTEGDLLKFSVTDVISYYPNPVKEELYLQWDLAHENYVTLIQIYSITGQLLRTYQATERINSLNISFQSYATGVYIITMSYKNGEEKTIKIIKQ